MYRLYPREPERGLRGLARVLRRLPAPRRRDRARPRRRGRAVAATRTARRRPPRPTARAPPGRRSTAKSPQPLRGASARIVENMEASLGVPTATSVRTLPAKLLEINRQILNNQLARDRGGKVSFTHLIGFAVVRALQAGADDERELRRRRRHAERRAPRAREPRARDRPAEVRRHAARCSSRTSRTPTRSTSPRSTPRTRTSSAGRARTS